MSSSTLLAPLVPVAAFALPREVLYALVIVLFAVVGAIVARASKAEFDYAVRADWLRDKRQKALADSSWLRFVDPIVKRVASVVPRMGLDAHRANVRRTLVHAGSPYGFTAEEFIGLAVANAFVAWLATVLLAMAATRAFHPFLALVPAVLVYLVSASSAKSKAARRRVLVDREMPFVLDIISLSMGAGSTFLQSVETITRVGEKGAMEEELDLMLHEMRAGSTLKDALKNMTRRSDSEELALMVTAVTQAEELGTPLVTIFKDQAETNRFRRSKAAEKSAAKIPNRLAVPTVFLMLAVLILLFGPIIVKTMRGGMLS
jgi:Flp pilus assembly protein TadB